METIKINLATIEYQDKKVAYPILVGVFIILLILSGLSTHTALRNKEEIKEYEKRIAQIEQTSIKRQKQDKDRKHKLSSKEIKEIKKNIDFVNKLITTDTFSWDGLLDDLENSVPSGITLSDFKISKDQEKVNLRGKSLGIKDITTFLDRLNGSKIYKNNTLINLSLEQGRASPTGNNVMGLKILFEISSFISRDGMKGNG